jgi:hypothetical protein
MNKIIICPCCHKEESLKLNEYNYYMIICLNCNVGVFSNEKLNGFVKNTNKYKIYWYFKNSICKGMTVYSNYNSRKLFEINIHLSYEITEEKINKLMLLQ